MTFCLTMFVIANTCFSTTPQLFWWKKNLTVSARQKFSVYGWFPNCLTYNYKFSFPSQFIQKFFWSLFFSVKEIIFPMSFLRKWFPTYACQIENIILTKKDESLSYYSLISPFILISPNIYFFWYCFVSKSVAFKKISHSADILSYIPVITWLISLSLPFHCIESSVLPDHIESS